MNKLEAKFEAKLGNWIKHCWNKGSALTESKVARGKSLPYSAVSDKQINNLITASRAVTSVKFSDFSRMGTPADRVILQNGNGYIVIQYHQPRIKHFYVIHIHDWIRHRDASTRKSITEEECRKIGQMHTFI